MSYDYMGGFLKDIPEPLRRRFPSKERHRRVEVFITVFGGIGVHYHASVEEEFNPVWNPERERWTRCRDDKDGNGRKFWQKFDRYTDAELWIREIVREHFNDGCPPYRIIKAGGRTARWFYKREGD